MELRILINNRSEQFAGTGRDYLCDFQEGVQYQFPYPVRYGQLESIASGLTEEWPEVSYASKRFTAQSMLCIAGTGPMIHSCLTFSLPQ